MVERGPEKAGVGGSIPSLGTVKNKGPFLFYCFSHWENRNGPILKSCVNKKAVVKYLLNNGFYLNEPEFKLLWLHWLLVRL